MSQFYKLSKVPVASDGWESVACPLCQEEAPLPVLEAPDTLHHIPGLFKLVQCEACGFHYTNPRPTAQRIGDFYPDDASYYCPSESASAPSVPNKIREKLQRYLGYDSLAEGRVPFDDRAEGLYRRAYPRFIKQGRLLEIGCSYGEYLAQMQSLGWQVEGVELNQRAAEFAQQQLGLKVWRSPVEALQLPAQSFDCIVMRMSLEHIHSPLDVLAKLFQLLKPGGEMIITVPNYGSIEAKLFGEFAYFLQLPTHLSHFTPKTITAALQKTGYEIDRISFVANKNDVVKSAEIMRSYGRKGLLLNLLNKAWFVKSVVKLGMLFMRALGRSPRMTVYASKRDTV